MVGLSSVDQPTFQLILQYIGEPWLLRVDPSGDPVAPSFTAPSVHLWNFLRVVSAASKAQYGAWRAAVLVQPSPLYSALVIAFLQRPYRADGSKEAMVPREII